MSYEIIEERIGTVLRKYWKERPYMDPQGRQGLAKSRVISLDMETAPLRDSDVLTNERILAIAVAKRISGEFMLGKGIKVESWLINEDTDVGEYALLEDFSKGLSPEPLAVIGYGIRDYDLPLLSIKMKRYDPDVADVKSSIPLAKKLWPVINMLERAVHLDLMTRLRFELRVPGFDEVIDHEKFSHIPLRRVKHPVRPKGMSPGEHGYTMWRNEPQKLKALVEAHAHDILLITECEFFSKTHK